MASRTSHRLFVLPSLLFLALGILLTGCDGPIEAAHTITPTSVPSATAQPSATALPSATTLPTVPPSATPPPATVTPAATPIPPATPTPSADFAALRIDAVEKTTAGYRINLYLPGVQVEYDLVLSGHPYACTLVAEVPDRLFCNGLAAVTPHEQLPIVLFAPGTKDEAYRGTLRYIPIPTPTPEGYAHNDCPSRGENASCETECRQLPEGGFCVVATCTDACGIYFSVATCPQNMSSDFPSCTEEQWAEARRLYSLP